MDFSHPARTGQLRRQVQDFMDRYIVPAIPDWQREVDAGNPHHAFMVDLMVLARDEGLW